jgi:hypothetical protein
MAERLVFLKKLFKQKEEKSKLMPNCYGFAFSLVNNSSEEYRDPEKIWDDCKFVGIIQDKERTVCNEIPYLKKDLPVIKDFSQIEFIVVLDPWKYLGSMEVAHVIANKPNKEGNILHRPNYNKTITEIRLEELMYYYSAKGMLLAGFNSNKQNL